MMSIVNQDEGLDLAHQIRSLPAKRRRALIALLQKQGVDLSALGAIPARVRTPGERSALSFAQQRLWFLSQLDEASAAYNVPMAVRLRGALDRPALLRSLEAIVQRHQVLRMRFGIDEGVPFQFVADDQDFAVVEEGLADAAELPGICTGRPWPRSIWRPTS